MVSSLKIGRTGGRNWRDTVEKSVWSEETIEEQRQMIAWYTKKRSSTSPNTEEWQKSRWILTSKQRLCYLNNKVSGPEDSVVSEMIKQLPLEKLT